VTDRGDQPLLPVTSRSRSNIAETTRQPSRLAISSACAEGDREASRRVDHAQRDQRRNRDRREARERRELLGDTDVARPSRDPDGEPDRPGGDKRCEDHLGEDVGAADQRRCDARVREQLDAR
jgi:hypothetical protein